MDSDPIGEITRRLAWTLVGAAAMDAADEGLTGFGRRFPRTLRFARFVGGAFLVLVGLFEAVLAIVVFAHVAYSGEFAASLFLLIPLAFGVGITVWGLGMMRRGWASSPSVQARTPWPNPVPNVPKAADEHQLWVRNRRGRGRVTLNSPEGATPGSVTSTWLKVVAAILLWIAGSVLALVAGMTDALAFWLGGLFPLAAFLVPRLRRYARDLRRWPGPRRSRRSRR